MLEIVKFIEQLTLKWHNDAIRLFKDMTALDSSVKKSWLDLIQISRAFSVCINIDSKFYFVGSMDIFPISVY